MTDFVVARTTSVCVLALVLLLGSSACTDDGTPSARAVEGRLIAPCCWIQTLDVHESELATTLREEIQVRLARGERAEDIEDDFAARFGEHVRAVPKGGDPRPYIALFTAIVGFLAGLGLIMLVRRWTATVGRRAGATAVKPLTAPRDSYDDRIDEELAVVD